MQNGYQRCYDIGVGDQYMKAATEMQKCMVTCLSTENLGSQSLCLVCNRLIPIAKHFVKCRKMQGSCSQCTVMRDLAQHHVSLCFEGMNEHCLLSFCRRITESYLRHVADGNTESIGEYFLQEDQQLVLRNFLQTHFDIAVLSETMASLLNAPLSLSPHTSPSGSLRLSRGRNSPGHSLFAPRVHMSGSQESRVNSLQRGSGSQHPSRAGVNSGMQAPQPILTPNNSLAGAHGPEGSQVGVPPAPSPDHSAGNSLIHNVNSPLNLNQGGIVSPVNWRHFNVLALRGTPNQNVQSLFPLGGHAQQSGVSLQIQSMPTMQPHSQSPATIRGDGYVDYGTPADLLALSVEELDAIVDQIEKEYSIKLTRVDFEVNTNDFFMESY